MQKSFTYYEPVYIYPSAMIDFFAEVCVIGHTADSVADDFEKTDLKTICEIK